MPNLKNQIAVITGASSGIGKAIALSLASQGAALGLIGRNLKTLEAVAEKAKSKTSRIKTYQIDLNADDDIQKLKPYLEEDFGHIDILIHSAGAISLGLLEGAKIEDFDWQYRINVRAPYLLTQLLLPMIKSRHGQIVFINSSVGLNAKANVGQYAATKHALKAIADSLRDEVNAYGIRVLSIYPGRTATPMQAAVHQMEGKAYEPEKFMQPEDVAEVVVNTLSLPRTAEVTDINIRPLDKI
jgi:NADP-dependent 3-hydroxy acid dehydrogenase YdfG